MAHPTIERAYDRARRALMTQDEPNTKEGLTDLLADLLHLRGAVEVEDALRIAKQHYEAELPQPDRLRVMMAECIRDPDLVGETEYRAVWEMVTDTLEAEAGGDPEETADLLYTSLMKLAKTARHFAARLRTPEMLERVELAKEWYGNDEREIDADALVSMMDGDGDGAPDGAWVQAWLYVRPEEG